MAPSTVDSSASMLSDACPCWLVTVLHSQLNKTSSVFSFYSLTTDSSSVVAYIFVAKETCLSAII
jgi:hypothetical protein